MEKEYKEDVIILQANGKAAKVIEDGQVYGEIAARIAEDILNRKNSFIRANEAWEKGDEISVAAAVAATLDEFVFLAQEMLQDSIQTICYVMENVSFRNMIDEGLLMEMIKTTCRQSTAHIRAEFILPMTLEAIEVGLAHNDHMDMATEAVVERLIFILDKSLTHREERLNRTIGIATFYVEDMVELPQEWRDEIKSGLDSMGNMFRPGETDNAPEIHEELSSTINPIELAYHAAMSHNFNCYYIEQSRTSDSMSA